MFVIAVTGGLGSGKSTAAKYFESRGAITLDLDEIARGALYPGSEALAAVVEVFGTGILKPDGSVDRDELAKIAFADAGSTARLNSIVHPVVLREVIEGITNLRLMERPPRVVVLEIPLLPEAPVFAEVADTVLAIEAPLDMRIEHAVGRGMDLDEVWRRVSRQSTDEDRAALADHVIVNSGSMEDLLAELGRYWDEVAPVGT
ncbi:MAG: dephospho-CoA kinase [Actinomycetota bacterium]|jgi:dephospho-CoA kinase|nr:dephospho-CoA kinase [Actinomycetota bacterium]